MAGRVTRGYSEILDIAGEQFAQVIGGIGFGRGVDGTEHRN